MKNYLLFLFVLSISIYTQDLTQFIQKLPKAELHLHIEGTLEPELLFQLAERNGKTLKYANIEALKKAYSFNNLQDFLDIYYEGTNVLIKGQDFYDLTWAYLEKAKAQNILHTEIFFDPQTHTDRNISFDLVIENIARALKDGQEKLGISSKLILSFLRHLDEKSAEDILKMSLKHKELIVAIGLDSSEKGNPPSKFKKVFEKARKAGFKTVAHAGEEGPSAYIWEALNLLKVSRIDHGNRAMEDEKLIQKLLKNQIPLTLCPLSNLKLKVIQNLPEHPLKKMLNEGLLVSINSDDPAYFGGYINENYQAIAEHLKLSKSDLVQLAKNSFQSSFLSTAEKNKMIQKVEDYYQADLKSKEIAKK